MKELRCVNSDCNKLIIQYEGLITATHKCKCGTFTTIKDGEIYNDRKAQSLNILNGSTVNGQP